jgi:hypothetical protein
VNAGKEIAMKLSLLVAAAVVAMTASAEANCSKSSLNGGWSYFPGSGGGGPAVTMSGAQFTIGGVTFKIATFGSNCRGTGTMTSGGTTIPILVTSESIKSSSAQKPNHLVISQILGPTLVNTYLFRR